MKPLARFFSDYVGDSSSFFHKVAGLTLHVPAVNRDIVDEAFGRQVDDRQHLERIARIQ